MGIIYALIKNYKDIKSEVINSGDNTKQYNGIMVKIFN